MREFQNFTSLNNNKILVVLPINKLEDFYLNESLYALAQQESPVDVLILTHKLDVTEQEVIKTIASGPQITIPKKDKDGNVTSENISAINDLNYIMLNSDSDTFSKVFNEGFNYALVNNYKYFTVLEYDDVVDTKWFRFANNFIDHKPELDGFLPLTREMSNGNFIAFFNEACWVDGFAEIAGIFDLTLMLRFNCMNITGTIFKTERIKEFSQYNQESNYYTPIKESIKINGSYEFFLRMIYQDLKFYTIPRIGYEHRIDRNFSDVNYFSSKVPKDLLLKASENGGISQEEFNFWNNQIKKEFYFDKDRNLQYQPK